MRHLIIIILAVCLALTGCTQPNAEPPATAAKAKVPAKKTPTPNNELAKRVNADKLLQDEREQWDHFTAQLPVPCDQAIPLASCLDANVSCQPQCVQAAGYLSRMVEQGYTPEDVRVLYELRYSPAAAVNMEIADAPTRGAADAPVTIVTFSDFQCPFCALAAVVLHRLEQEYRGKVRLVAKHFPLPQHELALPAAKAAVAAGRQDKFWEMHDLLFEKQAELEAESFEKYAKQLGLDVRQFRKDMKDADVSKTVQQDFEQAQSLGIRGTPTLIVNGRRFAEPLEMLLPYIDEELALRQRQQTARTD